MCKIVQKIEDFIKNRFLIILLMSFSSGFPLALIASTLTTRLSDVGISISNVGMFAWMMIPYSFKFLWAPLVDEVKLPILHNLLGQRRSWMLSTQVLLMVFILLLGLVNPLSSLQLCAVAALCVAFLSATQDIVIDAYRIEILPSQHQSIGATIQGCGYRVALYISGALPLLIAEFYSWSTAYIVVSAFMIIGICTTIFSPEPKLSKPVAKNKSQSSFFAEYIAPLKDLLTIKQIYYVAAFIVLFKLGDAMAGVLTNPFLLMKGFTKPEIVAIVKTYGLATTFVGMILGGVIAYRLPIKRALLIAGILQMLSNLLFVYQDYVGHDRFALLLTISGENIATGIGQTVMITYLSNLCRAGFAATQYALLSALACSARTLIAGFSGFIAEQYGWSLFFIFTTIAAIPALLLLNKITVFEARKR